MAFEYILRVWEEGEGARVASVCSFKWAFEDASLSCRCVSVCVSTDERQKPCLKPCIICCLVWSGTFSFIHFVCGCVCVRMCAVEWALWRRLVFTSVCDCVITLFWYVLMLHLDVCLCHCVCVCVCVRTYSLPSSNNYQQ